MSAIGKESESLPVDPLHLRRSRHAAVVTYRHEPITVSNLRMAAKRAWIDQQDVSESPVKRHGGPL
jgi:hypothetical protein